MIEGKTRDSNNTSLGRQPRVLSVTASLSPNMSGSDFVTRRPDLVYNPYMSEPQNVSRNVPHDSVGSRDSAWTGPRDLQDSVNRNRAALQITTPHATQQAPTRQYQDRHSLWQGRSDHATDSYNSKVGSRSDETRALTRQRQFAVDIVNHRLAAPPNVPASPVVFRDDGDDAYLSSSRNNNDQGAYLGSNHIDLTGDDSSDTDAIRQRKHNTGSRKRPRSSLGESASSNKAINAPLSKKRASLGNLPNPAVSYNVIYEKRKELKLESISSTEVHIFEPSYELVRLDGGTSALIKACKERCRDTDKLVLVVANTDHIAARLPEGQSVSEQVHRVGYMFPSEVVQSARARFKLGPDAVGLSVGQDPRMGMTTRQELLQDDLEPKTPAEIKRAIHEMFPKMPPAEIDDCLVRAWGENRIGRAKDMTLAHRIQFAVSAYIRHQHTDYDQLLNMININVHDPRLRRANRQHVRETIEDIVVDKLKEYRGENLEQLGEDWREVIFIDSDDEDHVEAGAFKAVPADYGILPDDAILQHSQPRGPPPSRQLAGGTVLYDENGNAIRVAPHTPAVARLLPPPPMELVSAPLRYYQPGHRHRVDNADIALPSVERFTYGYED